MVPGPWLGCQSSVFFKYLECLDQVLHDNMCYKTLFTPGWNLVYSNNPETFAYLLLSCHAAFYPTCLIWQLVFGQSQPINVLATSLPTLPSLPIFKTKESFAN